MRSIFRFSTLGHGVRPVALTITAAVLALASGSPLDAQVLPNDCASQPATILVPLVRPFAATPNCVSLVGTWQVTVSPNGLPEFTAYNVFSADGNSIEFDNSNPPGTQTIAVGPWKRTADKNHDMLEINRLFDGQGNYAGTLTVKTSIVLDSSGNKFSSKFTIAVKDPAGNIQFQGKIRWADFASSVVSVRPHNVVFVSN